MIQITPHMRVLVAVEPVDLRKGIDGLAAVCREKLQADPFSGWLFIFRSRRATAIRMLVFDGQFLRPCCTQEAVAYQPHPGYLRIFE